MLAFLSCPHVENKYHREENGFKRLIALSSLISDAKIDKHGANLVRLGSRFDPAASAPADGAA
jgi:hypothetical protein